MHGEWRCGERSSRHCTRCMYTRHSCCALQLVRFPVDGYGSCMRTKQKLILFSVAIYLVPEVLEHREVVNCVMGQIFRLEKIGEKGKESTEDY